MEIKIAITGLADANAKMAKLRDGSYKSGMMALCAALIQRQTINRIRSEKTAPDGTPWAPLSRNTRRKRGHGLLVDTGRLLGSIQASNTDTQAIVGTNVNYAGYLQYGTRKMPARPFLGLSKSNTDEVQQAVENFIKRMLP